MLSREDLPQFNPRFTVVGAIIEHEGEILLLHRQDHKPEGDTWCSVGGKVDDGESIAQAISREAREETGIDSPPGSYRLVQSYNVRYPDYDFVYHMHHLVLPERPEVRISMSEHKDYRWVPPSEALTLPLIQDEDSCIKACFGLD